MTKGPNYSYVDSTIEMLRDDSSWEAWDISIGKLEHIKEFLKFARSWKGTHEAVCKQLKDLVRLIEDGFETVVKERDAGTIALPLPKSNNGCWYQAGTLESQIWSLLHRLYPKIREAYDLCFCVSSNEAVLEHPSSSDIVTIGDEPADANFTPGSKGNMSRAELSCLDPVLETINRLAFSLNSKKERQSSYSTCVDSAIETIEKNCNSPSWASITLGLKYVQEFLKCVGRDEAVLVSSIEDVFETAGLQIRYALQKDDVALLSSVQFKLLYNFELLQPRIRQAYDTTTRNACIGMEKNGTHFTCLDPAIMNSYEVDYGQEWESVKNGLKMIQIFLTFASKWSDADKVVGECVGDLVSCIADEFETAKIDIENAMKEEYYEHLDALSTRLLEKVEVLKPRIREAYEFLSHYALQIRAPLPPPISDRKVWHHVCSLLRWNATLLVHTMYRDDISVTISAVQHFGELYLELTSEYGITRSSGIGFLMEGVAISLAWVFFLWWVDEMDGDDVIIMIWDDLLQRIKPTSPEIFDMYRQDLIDLPGLFLNGSVSPLVDLIMPTCKSSLKIQVRRGLHFLIDKLIDSHNPFMYYLEDVEVKRSEIEKIVINAASLNYFYILSCHGADDHLLFQLLQMIELVKVELVFTNLIGRLNFRPIYEGLSSVQKFLSCSQDVYSKRLVSIFERIKEVAKQMEQLFRSFWEGLHRFTFHFKLFLDFKILRIRAFLMEMMRCCPILMAPIEDKIRALDEGLELLLDYLSAFPLEYQGDEELILTQIQIVANEETPPYYFFRPNQVPRLIVEEMSVFLSSLMHKVDLLNSDIHDNAVQIRTSSVLTLPKTLQVLSFIDIFFNKLNGLVDHDSIGNSTKTQIVAVRTQLESLISFLEEVGEKSNEDPVLKDIRTCVVRASYEADYIIDKIILVKCDWGHMVWLSNVIYGLSVLKSELAEFVQMKRCKEQVQGVTQTSVQMIMAQTSAPQVEDVVVSLEDQEEIIIDRLTRGISQRREVVTISGMPGIGKTTLAKKVYENLRVKSHFRRLAWCCVSQVYRRRELLFEILRNVTKSSVDEMDKKPDEELCHMLYQSLKEKRYLVVMDDVWGTQAWEELRSAFTDDQNGSRILITTRNEEVGLKAQHNSNPHTLRFLNEEESWKLLREKVFHKNDCPKELVKVGMEIAEGCKGLPLAIVAIAGILKTTEKNADLWKQIEKDLNSFILENPEIQCMHILELSYNHLPDDLKPCFLYFAAFGEDNEVPVQKLIQLWIAEGFIREVNDQKVSLEDMAQIYVMNLISRSLLMVAKRGSNGRVKACKVHDMLYKLCSRKVKDEHFLEYINGYDEHFPSSTNRLDYGIDLESPPVSIAYEQHRLSICSKRKHFVMLKPSGPSVRTLLFSATSDTYPRCPYDEISTITEDFKILSILDIESINIGSSFPKGLEFMHPLRYLAISGDIRSIPSTIASLWNLLTFIVKGLVGKVALPGSIRSMSRLRHLHVSTQAIFSPQVGSQEISSSQVNDMVSLSCPALLHGTDSEEILKLFPKLRKLSCAFSEPLHHSEESIRFPTLDFLEELESLKIIYCGSLCQFCDLKGVSFPLNLKKLSLSYFTLTWDDFSVIGELPNLKSLKLASISFDSPIWEMKDDEFQQLEYLKLESLKFVEWNTEAYPLPCLQKLVLSSCIQLKEVPSDFGELATMQMIELKWCSMSAEKSVMAIWKQQLECNDGFKAFINGLDADLISFDD